MKKRAMLPFFILLVLFSENVLADSCVGLTPDTGAKQFLACIQELESKVNEIYNNDIQKTGPFGPKGPKGDPGPRGEMGPRGTAASLPTGAVIAFNSANCPSGWSEYRQAYGRFIRGIDVPGTTDPNGSRSPGNLQDDTVQDHAHSIEAAQSAAHAPANAGVHGYKNGPYGHNVSSTGSINTSSARVERETRPKNVALLYCVKN